MYEITMQLPFNSFHVKGKLTLPVKAQSLVIFSHGFGRTSLMPHEHRLALKFHQEGFGTLVFDLLDEHEEVPANYKNIEVFSNGLIASTNWLHSHSEYRSLNLGFLGCGTGSAAALKAAAELGYTIRSIVSLGGRLDLIKSELPKVVSPTLLIVGELDFQTVNINRHALDQLKGQKQIAVIPGASHLFEEPDKLNDAANISASWFKKYLPVKDNKTLSLES